MIMDSTNQILKQMNKYSTHSIQTFLFKFNVRIQTLKQLQWLYKYQHKEWLKYSAQILCQAIKTNHLDIVQWIHENCPWNQVMKRAMDWAAFEGQLEIIQWLSVNRQE